MNHIPAEAWPPSLISAFYGLRRWEGRGRTPVSFPVFKEGMALLYAQKGSALLTGRPPDLPLLEKGVLLCPAKDLSAFLPFRCECVSLLVLHFSLSLPGTLPEFRLPRIVKANPPVSDLLLLEQICAENRSDLLLREPMQKALLEVLLIRLWRQEDSLSVPASNLSKDALGLQQDPSLARSQIQLYLNAHLHESLTLDRICRDTLTGRTQLERLFHERYQCGILHYFHLLKIREAKRLIRQRRLNFSQIADALGYRSEQYFSRQFKKLAGISPAQYASCVRSKSVHSESDDPLFP